MNGVPLRQIAKLNLPADKHVSGTKSKAVEFLKSNVLDLAQSKARYCLVESRILRNGNGFKIECLIKSPIIKDENILAEIQAEVNKACPDHRVVVYSGTDWSVAPAVVEAFNTEPAFEPRGAPAAE